jgi:Pvc16 N-terminal domain/Carboxypeptidase regulatory-like domain
VIDRLDEVLHRLLKDEVADLRQGTPATVLDEQIVFRPPDESCRTFTGTLGTRKSLDVYLVDLRENRRLRSNEYVEQRNGSDVFTEPPPTRVDCHYVISAWSNTDEDHGKTLEEHRLLYQAAAALLGARPLVPRAVFAPDPLPTGFPGVLADAELPASVLPVEGFLKISELWASMGDKPPWKPLVYAVLTVPVVFNAELAGPAVTSLFAEYRPGAGAAGAETLLDIGGVVRDAAGAVVDSAWVRLETPGGRLLQSAATDDLGRFVFTRITANPYRLRAGAAGVGSADDSIDVPSPTGDYDLQLS